MHTYNDYSAWVDRPADLQPELTEQIRAEITIVGGGFTGLNAAIALSERGADVVLLESEFCGFGASGRNAGHLTPTIGRDIAYCLKRFGKERGVALARFADEAVHFTEEVFERYSIDCDYDPCSNIIAGVHSRQRASLKAAAEAVNSAGVEMTFLNEGAMRERQLPRSFKFGLQEGAGGLLDPGKYVRGLRQTAIDMGIRIYEQTPVNTIDENETITLTTPRGSVEAKKILVATNAFTVPSLDRMRSALAPLRVTLFSTRQLSSSEVAQLGWKGREGIYTAHDALESYRLTADNRIVGGSKWVQYGFGSVLPEGNMPDLFEKYKVLFRERFPEIPDVQAETFWGGWIGLTLDMLPLCGVKGKYGNVYHSVGYVGHGVAQATRLGWCMAQEMLGDPQEHVALLQRRTIPLPPEPFRWLGINAVTWGMLVKDGSVDRQIRKES